MATSISVKYFLGSALVFVLIICNALHVKAFECGTTEYTSSLIMKGMVTERGEWPFLTALYLAQEFKFFCAGSIISSQHVLTAAHCIQEKSNYFGLRAVEVVVLLGAYNLKLGNENDVLQRNVSEIYIHPEWDVFDEKYDADLAILRLNEIVSFTDYIRPVCMPTDKSTIDNSEGSVVGWGLTEIGTSPNLDFIKHTTTTTLNGSYCYTNDPIVAAMSTLRTFCGRGLDGNPNNGDSGGGFYILYGSAWVQYGILSAMRSNASGFVDANTISIYTNVMVFKNWINETVNISGETVGVAEMIVEIVLRCDYGTIETYKKYGCRVNDLNIRSDNEAVTSFNGSHKYSRYSNENVEIISFSNGTMFYLPFGIGNIFKNLKILEVNALVKTKRVRRSNFKNMVNLVHLQIESSDIEILDYDCFRNLPNLEVFALRYSKIQQINERTFETNRRLKEVITFYNELKILPEKIFQNNLLLETVNLMERRLTTIGKNVFEANTKLKKVVMNSNLTVLPENLFRNNSLLENVDLAGNSLTTIDELIFESNTALNQVDLSGNPLTLLPRNLFRNNLLLAIVYLSSISLNTIDETIFKNNIKLREIHLSGNPLKELPGNLFQNNSLLEIVDLASNSLTMIDEIFFERNTKLREVVLSTNQLESFPGTLFQTNLLLEYVNLSNNVLKTIEQNSFETNRKLKNVHLTANQIKLLPRTLFRNNLLLEIVNLAGNSITTIDETIFETNTQLSDVDLSGNQLDMLPRSLFKNNLLLESIDFGHNYLHIIEVDFTILPNIKHIRLKKNVCIDAFYSYYSSSDSYEVGLTKIQRLIHMNCTSTYTV